MGVDNKLYTRGSLSALWVKAPDEGGKFIDAAVMQDGTFIGVDVYNNLFSRSRLNAPWTILPNQNVNVINVSVFPNGTILGVGVDNMLYIRPIGPELCNRNSIFT